MRSCSLWKWILPAMISLSATLASAQGSDVVFLRGGGRLRGTVEVYEPGRRVVVLLPDGTRRRLSPGEFDRVVFADAPDAAEEVTPDPAPPIVAPTVEVEPPAELPSVEVEPAPADQPAIDSPQIIEVPPAETAPPSPAPEVQTLEATGAPTIMAARAFGDGLAETVPWPEEDPGRIARPTGAFHIGVQVLAAGRLAIGGHGLSTVGTEVAPYLDLRAALALHVRVLLVLAGFADFGTERDDGASRTSTTIRGHGVFELAGRLLVGILLSDGFAVRIGGQLGFEVLSHVERVAMHGDGVLELAIRLLDGRLELLLLGTAGVRTQPVVQVAASGVFERGGSIMSVGTGLGLGYVFY